MKIFYATSITYPSQLANRVQILATAKAFVKILGDNFVLSGECISLDESYIKNWKRSISLVRAFCYVRYIRAHNMSVVYGREDRLLLIMWAFSRFGYRKARFFYEIHSLLKPSLTTSFLFHLCSGFIVITHALKGELISQGVPPSKIVVAPDAVDIDTFKVCDSNTDYRTIKGLSTEIPVVTYAGSLIKHHDWKGIDVFLDCAMKNPDILFMVVGGSVREIELLQQTYNATNIRFVGFIKHAEVPSYLCASDILVIPNKKGSIISERYTSPMKLFEYMASGVPIVASNIPSMREIVSDEDVYFFTPNDSESLSVKIHEVFKTPADAKQRSEKALAKVLLYTWSERVNNIVTFIKKA